MLTNVRFDHCSQAPTLISLICVALFVYTKSKISFSRVSSLICVLDKQLSTNSTKSSA